VDMGPRDHVLVVLLSIVAVVCVEKRVQNCEGPSQEEANACEAHVETQVWQRCEKRPQLPKHVWQGVKQGKQNHEQAKVT